MSWQSTHLLGSGPSDARVLSVLAKRTYALDRGALKIADNQVPLQIDTIYSDPSNLIFSEVLVESDMVAYKPSTDVVVTGRACSPRGRRAISLDCEVRVGPLQKTVRVFGERKIIKKALAGPVFSDPVPFDEMRLSYSRAYGGVATTKAGAFLPFYPNPLGKGYALKGGFEDIEELAVPNQEDPAFPLNPDAMILDRPEDFNVAPRPASFGWTRPDFYPRYTYLGTGPTFVDGASKSGRPFSPKTDIRFYQGASDGLWGKQLAGNERVMLKYLDPDQPQIQFQLPGERPAMTIDLGEGMKSLEPALQTLVIDMNEKTVQMVWRGSAGVENLEGAERLEVRVG